MKHLQANDDNIERGKDAILDHVKAIMHARGVDPAQFAFEWSFNFSGSEWQLTISLGKNRHAIMFLEQDVREWLEYEESRFTYSVRIYNAIERLQRQQHEG